ncbi:MAG: Asp-tRNA(Asn)/Glu-tRNA(Gln) amidotransferase subunit GatC [Bdellovibrionales bacterium]
MNKKDVQHIANLAKLQLSDKEVEAYADQMARILKYFEELKKLNTEGAEPLITASDIEYWMREDEVHPGLGAEGSLKNAPS